MSEWRPLFKVLFWVSAFGAYLIAISPAEVAPTISSYDKYNHMIAFFTIALFMRPAYRSLSTATIALLLGAFGGFIEISQMIPALRRDASWGDWFADLLAIGVGLGVANLVLYLRDRRWTTD